MSTDGWQPQQYERFAAERAQPFHDLLALVRPVAGGVALDLGCGTGELTATMHRAVKADATVGIDNSPAMLADASDHAPAGVTFRLGDLRDDPPEAPVDLVFSNAALQWVPEHREVLARWAGWLRPGGQLAVQVPANADHPSHTTSAGLALESPFREMFDGEPPADSVLGVLPPAEYSELLHGLGFAEQHVRLQVYGHVLASTAEVVEWVKGTSLTRFKRALAADDFDAFVAAYAARLTEVLGDHRPYFYAFKRILLWARLPH